MLKGWKTMLGIVLLFVGGVQQATGVGPVDLADAPTWAQVSYYSLTAILGAYGRATASTPVFRSR